MRRTLMHANHTPTTTMVRPTLNMNVFLGWGSSSRIGVKNPRRMNVDICSIITSLP